MSTSVEDGWSPTKRGSVSETFKLTSGIWAGSQVLGLEEELLWMILDRYGGLRSDKRTWTCLFQLLADSWPLQARRFLRFFAEPGKEQGHSSFFDLGRRRRTVWDLIQGS